MHGENETIEGGNPLLGLKKKDLRLNTYAYKQKD
jgi:hypothetical protein